MEQTKLKPEELRLGNLIIYEGEVLAIDVITRDYVRAGPLTVNSIGLEVLDYSIPLTEDWLIRFGCKQLGPCWWETPNGIQFNFYASHYCGLIEFGPRHVNFWYVHTFQNIIALTGTELTLKEQ